SSVRWFYETLICFLFCTIRQPPSSPLFPYTTLFRSEAVRSGRRAREARRPRGGEDAEHVGARPAGAAARRPRAHRLPSSTCTSRSEEHTSELQSRENLVCRLLLEKKK